MKEIIWNGWSNFIKDLAMIRGSIDGETFLYRGQSSSNILLPKIARNNPQIDTTHIEKKMLSELRIRGDRFVNTNLKDIDLMAIDQHHGMSTRLLDWTKNPLVALWFACSNNNYSNNSHFYIYKATSDMFFDSLNDDPFSLAHIKILRPQLNNARIIAQNGWFTIHNYNYRNILEKNNGKFVSLNDSFLSISVFHIEIPKEEKKDILLKLDDFGINQESLFPDINGLCQYLNWQNLV